MKPLLLMLLVALLLGSCSVFRSYPGCPATKTYVQEGAGDHKDPPELRFNEKK